MAPFILGRTRDTLQVHFLFPTIHRKAVIERKVQAQRDGRRLGNRRHHPQDELSESERRRLDRIVALARPPPPHRP
jgi:IS5 family transposase